MSDTVVEVDGSKSIVKDVINGFKVVWIGYTENTREARRKFAKALLPHYNHLGSNLLPVVIISFNNPSIQFAVSMVQGACKNAPYIATANRCGIKKDCTIVEAQDRRLIGNEVANPDKHPAWGPPMHTSHAAGRQN